MTTPLFKTRIEPEDHLKLFKASPMSVSQFHSFTENSKISISFFFFVLAVFFQVFVTLFVHLQETAFSGMQKDAKEGHQQTQPLEAPHWVPEKQGRHQNDGGCLGVGDHIGAHWGKVFDGHIAENIEAAGQKTRDQQPYPQVELLCKTAFCFEECAKRPGAFGESRGCSQDRQIKRSHVVAQRDGIDVLITKQPPLREA